MLPPHRAARQERERRARPRRRLLHPPARPADECSLPETSVRDWQDWPELFDWSADRNMNPCPLNGTDQLARNVLTACVEPDGPVDADGDHALVIDDARHPAFPPGGEAARRY